MARSVAGGAAAGRLNRKFLVVAVLLATLSAALVYAKISATTSSTSTGASAGSTPIVVAKTEIKQRTAITAEMVQIKNIPSNAVIAGAFTNVGDVLNKVTKFPIEPNQQVVASAVVDTTKPIIGGSLAAVVPAGQRAISITVSQVSNAGGLILPGDFVDILWSCCSGRPVITKTILRNVQVAAVAQAIVNSGPVGAAGSPNASKAPVAAAQGAPTPDASTMTLLLSPIQAQQIFLAEANGSLRSDLRGVSDTDVADTGQVLFTDLLPASALNGLPEVLKPDGYHPGQ
jgi:pilus assembly protein CpaB